MAASSSLSMMSPSTVFLFTVCFAGCLSFKNDLFTEELFIKPLSRGYVYSHFQFTTKWNASIHDAETFHHYHLFPKTLGEVLVRFGVQELHLSQTQGLWRHKLWGYPVHDAPPGAELWVWFKPTVKDIDKAWDELVNAVSGLFCSSLNFLDSKSTVAPRWSFRPYGIAPQGYSMFPYYVRYGTLPREIVCTENLTPWKKLLPCDSKAGLSTLFNAFRFHDSNYHSLGLHVRPVCADSDCTSEAIELSQSLSVVTDVVSTSQTGSPNWNFKSLFGNHLLSVCPVASRSTVMIETTNNEAAQAYRLSPTPTSTEKVKRGSEEHVYAVYDVNSFLSVGRGLNVASTYNDPVQLTPVDPPPVHAHRYITGYGLENGGVSCLIYNNMATNHSILYMDVLPWFTRVFFNSLKVTNKGRNVNFKVHYVPAKDRLRPHHLELSFNLWAHSVTEVSFTFTRAYLKWTEYPPDANHGFYISSAIISTSLPSSQEYTAPLQETSQLYSIFSENATKFPVRIHTESLLVSLPTPDFSMPYNVICLACTVVAIAFGSLHNLTTRRFVKLDPKSKKGLKTKLRAFIQKLRGKKSVEGEQTAESKGDNQDTDPKNSDSQGEDNHEADVQENRNAKESGKEADREDKLS